MNLLDFFKRAFEKEYCLIIILVMIGMASFLPNLVGHDLWEPDELRCAEVAREMVVDGHWIVPHLEGEVYPDKPPLFFWLIALFSYCFGGLNPFSIHLPSALAGIGGMLIIYFFGKRLGNPPFSPFSKGGFRGIWTGLLASLILATMPCYFAMSITARMDILLTFFVSSALYCFYLAYSGYNSWFYLIFYFLMGLGTLTKGPIGFLIPFLTALSYLLVRREWKKILQIRLLSGFLVFAGTVASWVVPAIILGGRDYAYQILFHQNVDRYIGGWNHQNPFTYYFIVLPLILLPWTPLLPVVFITAITGRQRTLCSLNPIADCNGMNQSASGGEASLSTSENRGKLIFPIMWLITTFAFLSCSGSRGTIYLLPVLPAVSLSMAFLLQIWDKEFGLRSPPSSPPPSRGRVRERGQQSTFRRRLTLISYLIMPGLLIAGAIVTPLIIKHDRPSLFNPSLPILGILGVGSIVCLIFIAYKAYKASLIVFMATVLITSFTFCFQVLPIISQDRSVRMLFAEISKVMKPGDELYTYLIPRTGYSYYWGDVIKRIPTEEELRRYMDGNRKASRAEDSTGLRFCLMKEKHYESIKQNPDSPISVVLKMRASGIRFVLVTADTPRSSPR